VGAERLGNVSERRAVSPMIGRMIGVIVLCLLVGLFLTHLGIAARGILNDTWHTILSVGRLVGDVIIWAVPYILLGAVVVVPLAILGLVVKRPWR
jgi:Na+/H+-dicarboxylate symporter